MLTPCHVFVRKDLLPLQTDLGRNLGSVSLPIDERRRCRGSRSEGDIMLTLQGHRGPVCSLAYSPDGRILASGGADQTVRLWDRATNQSVIRQPLLLLWLALRASDLSRS